MKLKVIKFADYNLNQSCRDYVCEDEEGKKHNVDLFVDGGLPEGTTQESLIGKTVECDFLSPWIEIANGVRLIDNYTRDTSHETK